MSYSYLYTIMCITSYYNTAIECDLSFQVGWEISTPPYNITYRIEKGAWATTRNYNNYIDMTLNDSTSTTLINMRNDLYRNHTDELLINTNETKTADTRTIEETIELNTLQIAPNETKTIIYSVYVFPSGTIYHQDQIFPTTSNISGHVYAPIIHQEIIDIPGLMFTILTLPFSFISQGFNLTIFPNTPYQINFSNLFLTIISVFMILWIIKRILK